MRPDTLPPDGTLGLRPRGSVDARAGVEWLRASLTPFVDFDDALRPTDMQGWGADDPVFAEVLQIVQPTVVVEVGSWKGASAIAMASRLPGGAVVICVDTWLGTGNNFPGLDGLEGDSLRRVNGWPTIYQQFLTNVARAGVADRIVPLPQTSSNGAVILARLGIRADVVYLDGSHEASDVLRDLAAYVPLMDADGILIGDDIEAPGVRQAVEDYCRFAGTPYWRRGNKFLMRRSPGAVPPGFDFRPPGSVR